MSGENTIFAIELGNGEPLVHILTNFHVSKTVGDLRRRLAVEIDQSAHWRKIEVTQDGADIEDDRRRVESVEVGNGDTVEFYLRMEPLVRLPRFPLNVDRKPIGGIKVEPDSPGSPFFREQNVVLVDAEENWSLERKFDLDDQVSTAKNVLSEGKREYFIFKGTKMKEDWTFAEHGVGPENNTIYVHYF